jgi:hypothetical protein
MRNAHSIFVGKSEGKRPIGRSRPRVEDTIRINHRETDWDGVEWIHLAQDRD